MSEQESPEQKTKDQEDLQKYIAKMVEVAYNQGASKALEAYSYWKNGTQRVGPSGTPLKRALRDFKSGKHPERPSDIAQEAFDEVERAFRERN